MKSAWKTTVIFLGLLIALLITPSVVLGYSEPGPASAPVCNSAVPAKPWLYSAKAVGTGGVDLFWDKTEKATSWTVAYGVKSGQYIYGISNFGNSNSRSIRISSLPSGTYYFVVRANNDCMPGPFSNEWKVSVGSSATSVTIKPVMQITTPTPKSTVSQPGKTQVSSTPTTGKQQLLPTKSPTKPVGVTPTPTPRPAQKGFLQSLIDFFLGLFK